MCWRTKPSRRRRRTCSRAWLTSSTPLPRRRKKLASYRPRNSSPAYGRRTVSIHHNESFSRPLLYHVLELYEHRKRIRTVRSTPSTVAGSYTNLIFWIMDLVVKNINIICLVFCVFVFLFFPIAKNCINTLFFYMYVQMYSWLSSGQSSRSTFQSPPTLPVWTRTTVSPVGVCSWDENLTGEAAQHIF